MDKIDTPMRRDTLLTAVLQMQISTMAHVKALARSHAKLLSGLDQNELSSELKILTDDFAKEYERTAVWLLEHFVELKDLVDVEKLLRPGNDSLIP